jgi:iron complex outermembrane receptor protein
MVASARIREFVAAFVDTTEPRGYQVNQKNRRQLRSALMLGAASIGTMVASSSAFAQEQTTETVVVTGSRIPQQGLYAPSPVTAVGQQEMKLEGTTGVETLLNNLPSVIAGMTSGVSNGATGTATVDLRGLGANRTLVLINGSRLMPGDPSSVGGGITGAADLNQIPASLVDHVEVLTGGASAVYGSDALSGVVNFVMRKDFEGMEIDGQYGIAEQDNSNGFYRGINEAAGFPVPKEGQWDGGNETGTLIVGSNLANGKGNVTAYLGYQNTEAVLSGQTDFGACTIGGSPPGFVPNVHNLTGHVCAGSANYNTWLSLDNYKAHTPYVFFETGSGVAGSGTGKFVPFGSTAGEHFNFGALNYLQRPDTRYQGGFFAHYDVNKELEIYTSLMFTDDHTLAQIAPSGLFLGTGTISGSNVQVNCNNPLLTPQEASLICGPPERDARPGLAANRPPRHRRW